MLKHATQDTLTHRQRSLTQHSIKQPDPGVGAAATNPGAVIADKHGADWPLGHLVLVLEASAGQRLPPAHRPASSKQQHNNQHAAAAACKTRGMKRQGQGQSSLAPDMRRQPCGAVLSGCQHATMFLTTTKFMTIAMVLPSSESMEECSFAEAAVLPGCAHFGLMSSWADDLLALTPAPARPGRMVAVHSSLQAPPSSTNLQGERQTHRCTASARIACPRLRLLLTKGYAAKSSQHGIKGAQTSEEHKCVPRHPSPQRACFAKLHCEQCTA